MPAVSSSVTITIQTQLVWACARTSIGTVVASCDPIGLTVEAENETELPNVIAEAQHELMVDLFEDGELPRFLQDRGWQSNRPLPPIMPEGGVKFDVPFRVEPATYGHP
jgi:hypothetical protein